MLGSDETFFVGARPFLGGSNFGELNEDVAGQQHLDKNPASRLPNIVGDCFKMGPPNYYKWIYP